MYFGEADKKAGFTRRAYRDFNRTLHGFGEHLDKEDMKTKAAECLRKSLSDLTVKLPSRHEGLRDEFDRWHEETCGKIMDCFARFPAFSYGQAQKWLNMTIKYRWFFSESDPLNGYFGVAHVPVDDFVLRAAKARGIEPPTKAPWSRWDASAYLTFQCCIRTHAAACGVAPLEIEHRWWMEMPAPQE